MPAHEGGRGRVGRAEGVEGRARLTVREVAVFCGLTPDRIRQKIKAGHIPAWREGKVWVIPKTWLDQQHRASGGLFPSSDGRGLPGFLGALSEMEEDEVWRKVGQVTERALLNVVGRLAAQTGWASPSMPQEGIALPTRRRKLG